MSKKIWVVLKKELTDIIRDKRTLITSILIPMIMYPIMFSLIGGNVSKVTNDAENDTTIALMGEAQNADVRRYFEDDVFYGRDGIKIVETDEPIQTLANGDVKIVLYIAEGTAYNIAEGNIPFELIYDENRMSSQSSLSYVRSIIEEYNQEALLAKLTALGIYLDDMYPLKMQIVDVTKVQTGVENSGGNSFLSMIVPLLMSIFLAMSGMAAAVDIFAGEKERKTLEPLLATKAPRAAILIGKFIAVSISGIFTTTAMMLGMGIGYYLNPSMMSMGMDEMSINISASALILSILLVLIMTMVFTGIHVAISAISKNMKEASTYSSFVMLAGMLPGYMTMFLQSGDIERWMMTVPVYNVLGAMKMVLGGNVKYDFLILAVVCSVAFLFIVMMFVQGLFKKESVMFRM